MNNTETEHSKTKPGGTIDSWCGKCKLVLAHTIEAMVGDKPVRVHCNTCKTQHTYRANPPGVAPKRVSKPRDPRKSFLDKINSANPSAVKVYSIKGRYGQGDVLDHA